MNKGDLQNILDQHNLWLSTEGEDGSRANLSGADLSGANLRGADLYGADLNGADLSGANLTATDLREAKGVQK